MDHILERNRNFVVEGDIESGRTMSEEAGSPVSTSDVCSGLLNVERLAKAEFGVSLGSNVKVNGKHSLEDLEVLVDTRVEGASAENLTHKKIEKDRRKSSSNKKPPRPPRPPRGLSLDAADQKLIKEFAELARIKRARIEQLKALKKAKAAKASSSASSSGNFLALLFTAIFCVVVIFQGMCPGNGSNTRFPGSPEPVVVAGNSILAVQDHWNLSTGDAISVKSGSFQLAEEPSDLAPKDKVESATG